MIFFKSRRRGDLTLTTLLLNRSFPTPLDITLYLTCGCVTELKSVNHNQDMMTPLQRQSK